jgi:hypothetical protein
VNAVRHMSMVADCCALGDCCAFAIRGSLPLIFHFFRSAAVNRQNGPSGRRAGVRGCGGIPPAASAAHGRHWRSDAARVWDFFKRTHFKLPRGVKSNVQDGNSNACDPVRLVRPARPAARIRSRSALVLQCLPDEVVPGTRACAGLGTPFIPGFKVIR